MECFCIVNMQFQENCDVSNANCSITRNMIGLKLCFIIKQSDKTIQYSQEIREQISKQMQESLQTHPYIYLS